MTCKDLVTNSAGTAAGAAIGAKSGGEGGFRPVFACLGACPEGALFGVVCGGLSSLFRGVRGPWGFA